MLALRPNMPGKRFKPSGPNILGSQRHTVKLEIRCAPELAASARALCAARGITLAQILAAGLEALGGTLVEAPPSRKKLDPLAPCMHHVTRRECQDCKASSE